MPRRFLDDEAKETLLQAVRAIESRSSAEVVVAVRAGSGSYLHADLVVGTTAALLSIAFLLFSPREFGLRTFLVDPVVVGLLAGALASRIDFVRRLLSPPNVRRQNVRSAARAAFVERGVHRTRQRSGVLVYVSILERIVEVVVDAGVEPVAESEAWKHAVQDLTAAVAKGGNEVASRMRALGDLLASALPRTAEDVNELPDEVTWS